MRIFGFFCLLFPLFSNPLKAGSMEIYQYIDATGTIHFTNVPTDPRFKRMDQGDITALTPDKIDREALNILIDVASKIQRLPPALTMAVIRTESNFNPRAVSISGAQGLMQLMPGTSEDLKLGDPFDPEENIHGGTRYLRYLLDRFDQNLTLALAAYHAGPGTVSRYGGIPPIRQTKRYIKKVLRFYDHYLAEAERKEKSQSLGSTPGPDLVQNISPPAKGKPSLP